MEEKKNNKILIIVLTALISLLVGIGGTFAVTKFVLKDNKYEESVKTEEKEEDKTVAEPITSPTNGQPKLDKSINELFKQIYLYPDNLEIIKSSNDSLCNNYVGDMFNANITDEYKVLYTIQSTLTDKNASFSPYYKNLIDYIFNGETEAKVDNGNFEADFEIDLSTLNNQVSKLFASTKISNGFETAKDKYYYEAGHTKCENDKCTIHIRTGLGGTGPHEHYNYKLMNTKYNSRNDTIEYTVSAYYVKPESKTEIYDKKDGNLIKTITEDSNSLKPLYIFETYEDAFNDSVPTYKFAFKDSQLQSVEIVK